MRILLVDDEKDYLVLLERWISVNYPDAQIDTYDLVAMPEPSSEDNWQEYDLIFLDYQLGPVDGLHWLELLKVVDEMPPIIFITGQGDEDVAARAIKLGAEEYVSKSSLTAARLSEVMRDSLGKSCEMPRAKVVIETIDDPLQELDMTSLQNRIKNYTLILEIGRSSRGVCFGAEAESGDSAVIKVVGASMTDSMIDFIEECDQLSVMQHPNIASISTAQVDEDFASCVMPYYENGNLHQRIHTGIHCADAVRYAHHIAYGLAYLHEQGIMHHKLTPQNVLINDDDKALLTDIYTGSQLVVSNAYTSPEQQQGQAPSIQSNLYSVGLMLHEMLTGETQCSVGDLENTLPGYNQPMRQLMQRLLAIDPKARPLDAWALMDELLDVEWICASAA